MCPDEITDADIVEEEEILSEEESLSKLRMACQGCTGDDACCAITGLRAAGWIVRKKETPIGFLISFTRPIGS